MLLSPAGRVVLIQFVTSVILSYYMQNIADENQQAPLKDPLHVPIGLITRARSKKIKEAFSGRIQDIQVDSTTRHSKLGPKEDEGVINLIQATDGDDHA